MGWLGRGPAAVQVLRPDESTAARGAAHYAWRRRQDIPGYYDTVPDLQINALVELRPAFVSLMQGQERVPGGQRIGPREVPGFAIKAEDNAIDYYLTRSDEATVRLTKTRLPNPPSEDTPIKLIVTQTPGQGFARVEIRPTVSNRIGAAPVFLDWDSMTDTGKTPEDVLDEMTKQCGLAYPDPTPFSCHAAVWQACNVVTALQRFIMYPKLEETAVTCMSALATKRSLDGLIQQHSGGRNPANRTHISIPSEKYPATRQRPKFGIFDSDGNIPPEDELERRIGTPPLGYDTYRALVDAAGEIAGQEFQRLRNSAARGNDLHRRLLLIGGWFYTSAPPQIMDYARDALGTGRTLFNRFDFNVAGRCFSSTEDIILLFHRVHADFRENGLTQPFDRTKALSLILAYRPDAPFALGGAIAYSLVNAAVQIMATELVAVERHEKPKLAGTFFAAVFLLMGLLRYRRKDASFLDQSQPANRDLAGRIRDILTRARETANANLAAQWGLMDASADGGFDSRDLFEQISAFIEARGTDALIFTRIDTLSD